MGTSVVLLVGLPGAGKSSLARRLCESIQSSIHIEYDGITASLIEGEELEAWRRTRSIAVENLAECLSTSPSLVVMDDNFHLRSMRKAIYRVCQKHALRGMVIFFGVIFVDSSLELCLERNAARDISSRVDKEVIQRMATILEPPVPAKGMWDSSAVSIDGNSLDNIDFVAEWLSTLARGKPVPQLARPLNTKELKQEREVSRDSIVYQYDQIFRRWVGHVAKINKQSTVTANLARKKILQEVRSGTGLNADIVIDQFCRDVCIGWSHKQVEELRVILRASL